MPNKTIYHLLPGEMIHLCPSIIKETVQSTSFSHYFILYLTDNNQGKTRLFYEELFVSLKLSDYAFIDESYEVKRFRLIIHNLISPRVHRVTTIHQERLYSYLLNFSGATLLVHGEISFYGDGIYEILASLRNTRFAWVCWGKIPDPVYSPWYKFLTLSYRKDLFFRRISEVICLTPEDKKRIEERFHPSLVVHCPYKSRLPESLFIKKSNKVLVGNSGHYLKSYYGIIGKLSRFKDLDITFMLPYGNPDKSSLAAFKDYTLSIWPYSSHFWEDVVDFDEYRRRISSFSVYICGAERQTGIGAVKSSVLGGLKVYLNGNNYNNFREMGLSVHEIKELDTLESPGDLFYEEDAVFDNNRRALASFYDYERTSQAWEFVYSHLFKS